MHNKYLEKIAETDEQYKSRRIRNAVIGTVLAPGLGTAIGYYATKKKPDKPLEKEAKTLKEIEEDRLYRNRRGNSAQYYGAAAGAAAGAASYLGKPTGKNVPTGKVQAGKPLKMRKERIMDYVKRSPGVRKSHLAVAGKRALVGAGVGYVAGQGLKSLIRHNSDDKAHKESKARREELRQIRKERNHKKV